MFILGGEMEIGLQDKTSRLFRPGEHFYSADLLPAVRSLIDRAPTLFVDGGWAPAASGETFAT